VTNAVQHLVSTEFPFFCYVCHDGSSLLVGTPTDGAAKEKNPNAFSLDPTPQRVSKDEGVGVLETPRFSAVPPWFDAGCSPRATLV
jgi:hypothetical protein